jgi:hypothetical protein
MQLQNFGIFSFRTRLGWLKLNCQQLATNFDVLSPYTKAGIFGPNSKK